MTDGETPVLRRGRGRRPAAAVRASILAAAAALLFEEGIRSVTFDRVASAAGVSKMTVYKWWASPGSLAAEAFFARSEPALAFRDTGDVRADVASQLHAFVRLLTDDGAGRVLRELIGAAQTDPDLSKAVSTGYTAPRRALAVDLFRRARERGQLRSDVDLSMLVDQLWGACYNRLLIPDEPLNAPYVDALVENVFLGAASAEYRESEANARSPY
ncbi:MAG: TetR/AcrR family transcriptional regulator C-terminal ligand-binding domain-containing protein [Actinomycetota bacterium]|nr:TetR/AcrR family transcriptional regulator C-terminal ligand-binding domain-containing protein [Actinomycetota bacterium]